MPEDCFGTWLEAWLSTAHSETPAVWAAWPPPLGRRAEPVWGTVVVERKRLAVGYAEHLGGNKSDTSSVDSFLMQQGHGAQNLHKTGCNKRNRNYSIDCPPSYVGGGSFWSSSLAVASGSLSSSVEAIATAEIANHVMSHCHVISHMEQSSST